MEGHGAWRSSSLVCEPGVHYKRNDVLCICNEDGNWPNPICRDIFRILHPVETLNFTELSETQNCFPTKSYTIGCNVCKCPLTGRLDSKYCTNMTCSQEDPLLKSDIYTEIKEENSQFPEEIYYECNANEQYSLGCQFCKCLKNNRLICDNCTIDLENTSNRKSICQGKKWREPFNVDCNICFCERNGMIVCSTNICLKHTTRSGTYRNAFKKIDNTDFVEAPVDDYECEANTKYKRDCNVCHCFKVNNGSTAFSCSKKQCSKDTLIGLIETDCVEGTVYEKNCHICRCSAMKDVKWEHCEVDERCTKENKKSNTLHGYCEPLHRYKSNCNKCVCLSNGRAVQCTSNYCDEIANVNIFEPIYNEEIDVNKIEDHFKTAIDKDLEVEIYPVLSKHSEKCPNGHIYRVHCNVCVCLPNGNVLCSLRQCNKL